MNRNWIRIADASSFPLREGRAVEVGGMELAVFNLGDRFVAMENACPHRAGPLCDGIVSGDAVVCPLHAWKIDLDTGHVLAPDVCVKAQAYEVAVEDGVVMLGPPAADRERAA